MRICLLGAPRSGTTSCFRYIRNSLNLTGLNEPYEKTIDRRNGKRGYTEFDIWERDNVVVKHQHYHLKEDKIRSLDKYFDKVVVLYREDVVAASESWVCGNHCGQWDKKYHYEKVVEKFDSDLTKKLLKDMIEQKTKAIEDLKTLDYFTLTYEELFYTKEGKAKLDKYLNIDTSEFNYYFDPKNRLRQFERTFNSII